MRALHLHSLIHRLHLIKFRDIYKCSWKATSYQYKFTSGRLRQQTNHSVHTTAVLLPGNVIITQCIVVLCFLKLTWSCLYENDVNYYQIYFVCLILCRLSSIQCTGTNKLLFAFILTGRNSWTGTL